MNKSVILILMLIFASDAMAQIQIVGRVYSETTGEYLPMVKVVESGTDNEAITDIEGKFSILVSSIPTTLDFFQVGFVSQKNVVIDNTDDVLVGLKEYELVHYYDSRSIGLSIQSGVLNNPFGFRMFIASPFLFDKYVLKARYSLMSNLDNSSVSHYGIDFDYLISTYEFVFNLKVNRELYVHNYKYDYKVNTILAEFRLPKNLSDVSFILGYGFHNNTILSKDWSSASGPIFGFEKWFNNPEQVNFSAKVGVSKEFIHYQIQTSYLLHNYQFFIKYNKFELYRDLSIGFGIDFNY